MISSMAGKTPYFLFTALFSVLYFEFILLKMDSFVKYT